MKHKLIKTPEYLLVVDDSEIKEDDYRVNIQRCYVKLADKEGLDYYNKRSDVFKKAIAHLPLNDSPALEGVPLLPAIEVENDFNPINEYDKEYLSSLTFDGKSFVSDVLLATRLGYNRAREKYKFTEEDMIQIALECWGVASKNAERKIENLESILETHIQPLSQPKTPTHFEFEMRDALISPMGREVDPMNFDQNQSSCIWQKVIKTITNSQGQQVACGKYVFEHD